MISKSAKLKALDTAAEIAKEAVKGGANPAPTIEACYKKIIQIIEQIDKESN